MSKKYKDNPRIKVSLSQKWAVDKLIPTNVYLDISVCVITLYTCLFFFLILLRTGGNCVSE